jgi:urea carboxylase
VGSQVSGGVWSVLVEAGAEVSAGQALVVVESMKMEITVHAPRAGRVERVLCVAGEAVSAGQPLVLLS